MTIAAEMRKGSFSLILDECKESILKSFEGSAVVKPL